MAAAAARNWDAAETHFRTALDLAETLPHRVDQARVRYWFARALLDRNGPGDRDRAQQMLTEARALSESMGMHGHTQWIDAQLAGSRPESGFAGAGVKFALLLSRSSVTSGRSNKGTLRAVKYWRVGRMGDGI